MAELWHVSQPQPYLLKAEESSDSKPNKELLTQAGNELSQAQALSVGFGDQYSTPAALGAAAGRECASAPGSAGKSERCWGDGSESLLPGVEGSLLWSKHPIKPRKNKMSLQSPVGWEANSSVRA